jgi:hypothetical protein
MDIQRKELQSEFTPSLPSLLVSELKGEFTPLITTVKQEYYTMLGLPFSLESSMPLAPYTTLAGGELYLSKTGDIFYFKLSGDRTILECGGILKNGDSIAFSQFLEKTKSAAEKESKGNDLEWKTLTHEEAFKELANKGSTLNPTPEEIAVAKELEDPNLLRILIKTQNMSSFSVRDLSNFVEDIKNIETLLDKLVQTGLMTKDFVVLCREKGQQIIKVGSRQAIEETSQKGLKCFLCGKPISEESIEELLSCTDLARKLMFNGYWMPVRILEGLGKLGIKPQDVVEDSREDFFTLYFYTSGEIALIAPFDRRFTMQDAYTLNAKLSVSNASIGVLVSTQPISPIFREFLIQSNPSRSLHFIEMFGGFEEKLEQILKQRRQENVRKLLEPFTQLTPVVLRDLISQKFFPETTESPKSTPSKSPSSRKGKQSRQDVEPNTEAIKNSGKSDDGNA